jgi:hypothetical protein
VRGDQIGRPAGDDRLALRHDRDGVGEPLRLLDVVRRHEDRDALGAQAVDERPQLLANLRIEPDGGLVEEHEARPVNERPGDQEPPAHPAGQLVDAGVAAGAQVRDLERALHRRRALVPAQPVEPREHAQVLLDGERRVEVVELGDDAALGPRLLRLAGEPEAEHLELALVGDGLRRQHLHGGRLAGAVGAEETDARPSRHLQVEPVDGRDRPEALGDAPHPKRDVRLPGHARTVPA